MGIAARKAKEKEDMRRAILDAARALFLEHDYEHTSMRTIARRIAYSPTTIYLYFKDKDAIFHALHSEAFQALGTRFAPLAHVEDPLERLLAMGRAYLQFAMENPGLYDLMFIMQAPMCVVEKLHVWEEGDNVFRVLTATVEEAMKKKKLRKTDVEITSFLIWSTLHGMAALHVRDRCYKVIDERKHERLLENGLNLFIAWLKTLRP
jgi:AcrR family transcriptional regulator